MSNDLTVIQTQIAEAQESGDAAAANELYAAELAARAGQPAAGRHSSPALAAPAALPADVTESAWAAMHEADPDGARALESRWGADAGSNFAYAVAFARSLGLADEELLRLPDDPALYELAAQLGRERVHAEPQPVATAHQTQSKRIEEGEPLDVSTMTDTAFENHLSTLQGQIAERSEEHTSELQSLM